jgi:hypothetical protein
MQFRKVPRDFVVVDVATPKPRGRCRAKRCGHKTRKNKRGHEKYCQRCKSRLWKQKNPIRYAFVKAKSNAKRRKIEWLLTLEEWTAFVIEHNLMAHRGRERHCLSIDRRRSSEGYHKDNLKILTVSDNSRKGKSDDPF